jgi:hypothetical protein
VSLPAGQSAVMASWQQFTCPFVSGLGFDKLG